MENTCFRISGVMHACFACLLFIGLSSGYAQVSEADRADWVQKKFRLAVATNQENYSKTFVFYSDEQWKSVNLTPMYITDSFDYYGPPVLRLYSTNPSEGGTLLAEFNLAGHRGGDLLLLLIPRPGDAPRYYVYPLPNSPHEFPGKSVMLVNLSISDIVGYFSGETGRVKPGEYSVISFEGSQGATLRIMLAIEDKNREWDLVHNTTVTSRQNNLRWLILYMGMGKVDGTMVAQTLTFRDRVALAPPPNAQQR